MRAGTIFLDIDGTILKHQGSLTLLMTEPAQVISGVIDKLNEWEGRGFNIVLTTGRKESQRELTERQLENLGIFYDQLIMGIGGGPRYLVNDKQSNGTKMAFAYNIERNQGLNGVDL